MRSRPLWLAALCWLVSDGTSGVLDRPALAEEARTLIRWETRQLSDVFFSEGADCGDFNNDGRLDIVSGPFWYEGPDFQKAHPYYEPKPFDPHGYSDNFFAWTEDFNGDGWTDILIIGFPGKEAFWFENPHGQDRLWPRHVVLDVVDNESPTFIDITGDGRRNIVCSVDGYFGFAERNPDDPTAKWTFRRISDQSAGGRFTHGLGVGDVNGDGRLDLLEKSGWWEQPESLAGDPQWVKHPFPFSGPGGAQMYAFDVDGDGDNDVVTSLAAHGYGLVWYENSRNDAGGIEFKKHVILGEKPEENPYGVCFSQLHGIDVADIDGDGQLDIITGKRWWAHGPKGDAEPNAAPVLYWFKLTRSAPGAAGVEFVPHLIHDNSGIGVEVKAKDVNGDDLLDVIVGNKKGTFVSFQRREQVSQFEYDRRQPLRPQDRARAVSESLPPHDGLQPQNAAAAMTVPKGFQVQLAAAEPLVHQPVAFTIDERGRLWVAEAHTYPQRAPAGQGKDRILILEDQDLDGRLETRKVFIEGLNLVSGLEVGFGGVWVGAAPYLLFIPDRDGDDVPDGAALEPGPHPDVPPGATVLLDGWGYQDTHETLNAFLWGPDGWLYGCHGVFTHSRVGKPGTPDEQRTPLNCGVWRYHPTRHEFEVFAHGTSNPWGVDFNDHGQAFITACVIPHMYHVIQGGRYQRQAGQHFNPYTYDDLKTIADHAHYAGNIRDHAWWGRDEPVVHADTHAAGGGHAHCGAMIYLGDNWPTRYRNTLFVSNIHGNRVNNDFFRRNGSGFVASHNPDFLFANDRWFRGINLKYGPDGSVYLIDWYDPNACHRNQPEIWDRSNGRIYRITYGEVKPRRVDLAALTTDELVALHQHENDWYVRMSRRLLQQAAALSSPPDDWSRRREQLTALIRSGRIESRLRALWLMHVTAGVPESLTLELLSATGIDSEYLRAWAVQLELEDRQTSPQILQRLVELARSDPSPVVRLYLAAALQRLPLEQRWEIAEALLHWADDASDPNIPLMIWYGVEPLVSHHPDRALQLAGGAKIPLVAQFLYRRAAADPAALPKLLAAIASAASEPQQQTMLAEVMTVVKTSGQLPMPEGWPAVYARLSQSENADIRRQAQFITVKFGDKSIFPALRQIAADPQADLAARSSAVEALVSGKDPAAPPVLLALLDVPPLRSLALRSLAAFDAPETPAAILARYSHFDEPTRQEAIATLASRTPYALALLDAIEREQVPRGDLKAFTVAQMQQLQDPQLLARLNAVWGTIRSTPEEKQRQIAEYQRFLGPQQLARADLSHGRELYVKNCGKCHKLFGEGGAIGPDITGSNRANLDYILQNIVDPSALVGKDYQTTTVITTDGRVLNGLVKEENDTALVLQTATDVVVIDKREIDERKLSELSLMPEGQLKDWPREHVQDLIAYLASPRQVPLPGAAPHYDEATQRVAGALEGEALKVLSVTGGVARSQPMGAFTKDRWSGVDHLWWTGAKPGDKLVLELPVREAGRYELLAVMTKARDYGIVQLALDGRPLGPPIDLYNHPDVITTGLVSLGTHELSAGPHQFTVEITGAHPQAVKAYMFGLDYLYLVRPSTAAASN
jgi:putative membrane-bound dehydrogenase-like protein